MAKRRTKSKKRFSKFDHALVRLRKMKRNEQAKAMSVANKTFINQFCNKVKQLRHKNISAKDVKKLKRNSLKIRKLISKNTSLKKKQQILSQRGGFLSAILPILAPVLGSLASSLFGQR